MTNIIPDPPLEPDLQKSPLPSAALPGVVAGALAFSLSAAVLMLEILGVRVLAPYVGATLNTYTAIIGTVLTGISLGTWAGGKAADRHPPRRLLGPLVTIGGIAVLLAVPTIRLFAPNASGSLQIQAVTLSFVSLFFPAAILSAVNPALVKLQLSSLDATGRVVGRISALATAGAIVGTFVTGFLLVATTPTSRIIGVTGTVLVVLGLILTAMLWRVSMPLMSAAFGIVLVAGPLTTLDLGPCDKETGYYCVDVVVDPDRSTGRYLVIDDHLHSYTDVVDSKFLMFSYAKRIAAAIDTQRPSGESVQTLFLGGGGFTIPRYVEATRPGSVNRVLEVDPGIVDINKDQLGLHVGEEISVHVGDARLGIRSEPKSSYDFVIGDAFGQEAVPWHLTTQEFIRDIDSVMKPSGIYAMNIIDYQEKKFVRAELQTLESVFGHVLLLSDRVDGSHDGANFVVLASRSPIDTASLMKRLQELQPSMLLEGARLDEFIDDAMLLTDNFAPVDQLITPADKALSRKVFR